MSEKSNKTTADRLRGIEPNNRCMVLALHNDLQWPGDGCTIDNCELCKVDAMRRLADEVEAEIAEARVEGARAILDDAVADIGWPPLRDGETAAAWIERCWLPRPCFEDGEPVQFGDVFVEDDGGAGEVCSLSYEIGGDDFVEINQSRRRLSERVKRPTPEVLLADGLPARVGETVWLADEGAAHAGQGSAVSQDACGLCGVGPDERLTVVDVFVTPGGRELVRLDMCFAWCPASWLTHDEPDSIAKIEADASMPPRCYHAERIGHNTGLLDDEEVSTAVALHLLRRQRAVLARGGEQ